MERILNVFWFTLCLMVGTPKVMEALKIIKDGKNIEPSIDLSGSSIDPRILNHMSARTIYWNSFQGNTDYLKTDLTDVPTQCEPVHFSLMLRHGSTNPQEYLKTDMLDFYDESAGDWQEDSLLSDWTFDVEEDSLSTLADVGYEEVKQIAQRYRKRLPQFFTTTDTSTTDVVAGTKLKALQTGVAFVDGLNLGRANLVTDDTFIELYQDIEKVKDVTEYHIWQRGPEMKEVALKISLQLFGGNSSDDRISASVLDKLIKTCAFETIGLGQSRWCSLFDLRSTRIMEYNTDLHMSYSDFNNGNTIRGCATMRELLSQITNSTREQVDLTNQNETAKWKSWILTGHGSTMYPVYHLLNLFVDEQSLRANNFLQMANRKFRMSKVMPMAANFAIVTFRCDEEEMDDEDEITKLVNAFSNVNDNADDVDELEGQPLWMDWLRTYQPEEEPKVATKGKLYFQAYINEILVKFNFCDDTTCELNKLRNYVEHRCNALAKYYE